MLSAEHFLNNVPAALIDQVISTYAQSMANQQLQQGVGANQQLQQGEAIAAHANDVRRSNRYERMMKRKEEKKQQKMVYFYYEKAFLLFFLI